MSGVSLFLSAPEVAELLSVPPSTLRYWSWGDCAPEHFPRPVKVGHRVRYSKAAVMKWIEGQIEVAQSGGPCGRGTVPNHELEVQALGLQRRKHEVSEVVPPQPGDPPHPDSEARQGEGEVGLGSRDPKRERRAR